MNNQNIALNMQINCEKKINQFVLEDEIKGMNEQIDILKDYKNIYKGKLLNDEEIIKSQRD